MVDLLGRAWKFKESDRLIESMPYDLGIIVWGLLLRASKTHGNIDLEEKASNKGYSLGLTVIDHDNNKFLNATLHAFLWWISLGYIFESHMFYTYSFLVIA
ncbi:Pentatricopeptide repeat-containing protein [Forsythia ovata]|uniref:Pentatricopeptide repeat-containing protein n=1 Tax=Forsythia ovata TaxID=205694 RepID=A0ABD1VKL3_9LAMI